MAILHCYVIYKMFLYNYRIGRTIINHIYLHVYMKATVQFDSPTHEYVYIMNSISLLQKVYEVLANGKRHSTKS